MKNSRNSIVSKNSFLEVYFSLSPCLPMCLSICPFLSFAFICFLFDFTCATVSKAFEAHSHGITVNWIEISAALGDIVAAFFRFLHSRLSYKRSLKRPFLFLLLPRQIHRIRFYRQLLNFILEFPCFYIQPELIENRKHQTSVAHRKVRRREKIKRTNRMRISKEFEILRACVLQESNKNNHVFRIRNWIFLIFCRVFLDSSFPNCVASSSLGVCFAVPQALLGEFPSFRRTESEEREKLPTHSYAHKFKLMINIIKCQKQSEHQMKSFPKCQKNIIFRFLASEKHQPIRYEINDFV